MNTIQESSFENLCGVIKRARKTMEDNEETRKVLSLTEVKMTKKEGALNVGEDVYFEFETICGNIKIKEKHFGKIKEIRGDFCDIDSFNYMYFRNVPIELVKFRSCENCENFLMRDKENNCRIEDMYFKQIEKPCQHWIKNKRVVE